VAEQLALEQGFRHGRAADGHEGPLDVAQQSGGTYYLPYQLFYSKEQLHQCYPEIDDFFAIKKKYDPSGLFSNKFYEKYGM